jgi:hypothetical protein
MHNWRDPFESPRPYFVLLAEYLAEPLRLECDDIAHEPLPERWVELINHLNAREREQVHNSGAPSQSEDEEMGPY